MDTTMFEHERFNSHVVRTTTCWIWTGAIETRGGYGRFRTNHGLVAAHRHAWILHHGPITADVVRHHCDIRCCVNPAHLTTGSQADNVADTVRRGRWRRDANTGPRAWPGFAYRLRDAALAGDHHLLRELLAQPEQLELLDPVDRPGLHSN